VIDAALCHCHAFIEPPGRIGRGPARRRASADPVDRHRHWTVLPSDQRIRSTASPCRVRRGTTVINGNDLPVTSIFWSRMAFMATAVHRGTW